MSDTISVPFFSFDYILDQTAFFASEAINRVLWSKLYIRGSEVNDFESEFADYCNATAAVGVGNGLDALELSLRSCGVNDSGNVVVPSQTFIATWMAVDRSSAQINQAQVEVETVLLSARSTLSRVTDKTQAIVPVHLYGRLWGDRPQDQELYNRGISIIEDAAQAHGVAKFGLTNKPDPLALAFSFYPTKNLGCIGDGGCVVSNDQGLIDEVRELSNYGSSRKYHHESLGSNSRLDEIQAAVLRVRLAHLDEWNILRRLAAEEYIQGLTGLPLTLPPTDASNSNAWHLFVIRTARRDELREWLNSRGVETSIHYPIPPADQPAYAKLGLDAGQARLIADQSLSLPLFPGIRVEQIRFVVDAISEFFDRDQSAAAKPIKEA